MPPHHRRSSRLRPHLRQHVGAVALVTATLATSVLTAVPASATLSPTASESGPTSAVPTDRTPVGSTSLSPAALTNLLAPTRVLAGRRLVAKPPPPPPWQLPVAAYHLTGRFGQVSGLWATVHTGLDFAAPDGTPIHSIGPGTVVSTAYDGAYGNKTVVRLDDGTVLWYCHQSRFAVRPGQRLQPGDLVGYVGSTGNVTGAHLHLEVHPHGQDQAVDPDAWLLQHHLHP